MLYRLGKKLRYAKREARSELSVSKGGWRKHNYVHTDLLSTDKINDTLPRVHIDDITLEEFIEKYERPKKPVIIIGAMDAWPAMQGEWTPERLKERFGQHKVR